jgi:probable O-glycosylation ligase (exosortase A-associated)
MSLTAIAFWIAYISGLAAAIFNPVAGVILYILVYHLNPDSQWWGASVRAAGLRTSMTVALATMVGLAVRRPRLEPGTSQFPLPYVFAILFALVALGSLSWGVDVTPRGQYLAEKFFKQLVFLFVLIRCVRTPLQYHAVFMAWLIGVLYVGYEVQGGAGVNIQGRLTAGVGGPDFAESSGLGVHLTATLPLLGAAFFMARSWFGRIFALATGALTVNVLIATRTRNALVGIAVIALAGAFSLPRRYRLRGITAVIVGVLLSIQLTDPAWWTRMQTILDYEQDSSATRRIAYWKAALEMACDHPFGIGLGNFHHYVMEYVPGLTVVRSAHNTFMECLAETGWAGLALYLTVLWLVLWRLGQIRRTARDLPEIVEVQYYRWRSNFHLGWHAMALRTALLGYLACSMFVTRIITEDLWLLIGFSLCLENVCKRLAAEQPKPATDALPALPGLEPSWNGSPPAAGVPNAGA